MSRVLRIAATIAGLALLLATAMPAEAAVPAKKKKPKPKPKPAAARMLTLAELQAAVLTPEAAIAATGYAGTLAPTGINECVAQKFIECQANWTGSNPAVPYPSYALAIGTPDFPGGQVALGGRIGYWTQNGYVKLKESGDTWSGLFSAPDGSSASVVFGVRKGTNVVAGGCTVAPAPVDTTALKACATAVVDAQAARLPK